MLVAKRMIREIRLLRQFDHDNIIRIVDMLPPPSVEKFKDVYMVLDRMDTVRTEAKHNACNGKQAQSVCVVCCCPCQTVLTTADRTVVPSISLRSTKYHDSVAPTHLSV